MLREGMNTIVDLGNAHVDLRLDERPLLKELRKSQEKIRKKATGLC
jgi:hypothetical protein